MLAENEISYRVRGLLLSIHTDYGPGLLEQAYERILLHRLLAAGLEVKSQVPIYIDEDGLRDIVAFKIDLLVENKVIIELKSVEKLGNVHFKQLYTYLKLTGLKLGLLVNFNVDLIFYGGIHRVVNGLEED